MRRFILCATSTALLFATATCSSDSETDGLVDSGAQADIHEDTADDPNPPDDTGSPGDTGGDEPGDTAAPDTGVTDTSEPDDTADSSDADTGSACEEDTDRDGLMDCEEENLCTESTNGDSDGDGLSDFEELQRHQTDPCNDDSDNDKLSDSDEIEYGFDPNDPSTYGDTLDGERWVVRACEDVESEPISYHQSISGNWLVALPNSITNYTEPSISNFRSPKGAAVYDDPTAEVAGITLSEEAPTVQNSPLDPLNNAVPTAVNAVVEDIDYNSLGAEFTTHDEKQAAILKYEVETSQTISVRELRDRLLFSLGSFQRSDVSGLPNSSGSTYDRFRVHISAIHRKHSSGDETNLYSIALAPLGSFKSSDRVRFRIDDLTNTSNVADAADRHREACETHKPSKKTPKAEFYWVLDNSGSMDDENSTIKAFSNQFVRRIGNTRLDYRLGVTNTTLGNDGRLAIPPGWHRNPNVFSREIDQGVINCSSPWDCSASEQGVEASYRGLRYMLGLNAQQPDPPERIRSGASSIIIWISDEAAQGRTNMAKQMYANKEDIAAFSVIVENPQGQCQPGPDPPDGTYRDIATASGGAAADLCHVDIEQFLDTIIQRTTEIASPLRLGHEPISSSLRVYMNKDWVPRSTEDGFNYSPQRNVLTFYGKHRPSYHRGDPNKGPDRLAVAFELYKSNCKETGDVNTCLSPPP